MNKNDKKDNHSKRGFVDPSKIREFTVYHECELLAFLYEKMAPQSKKNIKSVLANHQVAVGGVPVSQFNFKLYPEDVVIVSRNRIAKHERKDLPIIYEDNDLIVIDKPSGLLSIASDREKGKTAYRLVSDYIAQNSPKARIFVVHRLDEDTSGVLLFAKNWEIREAFQNNWQELVQNRNYYAIVEGEMEKQSDTLKDYLDQNENHLVYVTKNKSRGKLAVTSYKVLAYKNGLSLLDVHISSGRKNQIRVQLGNIGHFVIGDDKYGEPSDPIKRLGLHAYQLTLKSPYTDKVYDFSSPMPESFKSLFFGKSKKIVEEKPQRKYYKEETDSRPQYKRKGRNVPHQKRQTHKRFKK